jgi:hypothetical protein
MDGPMQRDANDIVVIVKDYSVPRANPQATTDDKLRQANVDVAYLCAKLKQLESRNARLENEIQSEVKMLTAALDGEQETYDQVKRRISRLKGSLEYPGHE